MTGSDPLAAGWCKSTASASGDCVELAFVADGVLVRDSKAPEGPILRFSLSEWDAFLLGVRRGEFNRADGAAG